MPRDVLCRIRPSERDDGASRKYGLQLTGLRADPFTWFRKSSGMLVDLVRKFEGELALPLRDEEDLWIVVDSAQLFYSKTGEAWNSPTDPSHQCHFIGMKLRNPQLAVARVLENRKCGFAVALNSEGYIASTIESIDHYRVYVSVPSAVTYAEAHDHHLKMLADQIKEQCRLKSFGLGEAQIGSIYRNAAAEISFKDGRASRKEVDRLLDSLGCGEIQHNYLGKRTPDDQKWHAEGKQAQEDYGCHQYDASYHDDDMQCAGSSDKSYEPPRVWTPPKRVSDMKPAARSKFFKVNPALYSAYIHRERHRYARPNVHTLDTRGILKPAERGAFRAAWHAYSCGFSYYDRSGWSMNDYFRLQYGKSKASGMSKALQRAIRRLSAESC